MEPHLLGGWHEAAALVIFDVTTSTGHRVTVELWDATTYAVVIGGAPREFHAAGGGSLEVVRDEAVRRARVLADGIERDADLLLGAPRRMWHCTDCPFTTDDTAAAVGHASYLAQNPRGWLGDGREHLVVDWVEAYRRRTRT